MSLTTGQKADLQRFAGPYSESVEIVVMIGSWIPYTREFGSGFPISVTLYWLEDGEKDLSVTVSRCQHDYTALDKAKEIARYLRDDLRLGERVKLRSKSEHHYRQTR